MVTTEGELIDRLGGNTAVADRLGVRHNTVSGWRSRGFPPWATVSLREAAEAAGIVAAPALFEIKRPQRAA
jgi:hypothetical protein